MSWSIVFLFQGLGEGDPNVPVGVPPGLLSTKCEIKKTFPAVESCQRSSSKRSWRSIKAKTPLTAAKVRDWEEPKDMKLVKIQVSPFFTRSSSLST